MARDMDADGHPKKILDFEDGQPVDVNQLKEDLEDARDGEFVPLDELEDEDDVDEGEEGG